jgi:hypothetical protein
MRATKTAASSARFASARHWAAMARMCTFALEREIAFTAQSAVENTAVRIEADQIVAADHARLRPGQLQRQRRLGEGQLFRLRFQKIAREPA